MEAMAKVKATMPVETAAVDGETND